MELSARGGTEAQVARAQLLCLKKANDYNGKDDPGAERDRYFPFGTLSYAQFLHTKSQRFVSLAKKELSGEITHFEGLDDTALDIINYASFYLEWRERAKA